MVVLPSCSVPSAVVGAGLAGRNGVLDAVGIIPSACPNTRMVCAHVSLGWGAEMCRKGSPGSWRIDLSHE